MRVLSCYNLADQNVLDIDKVYAKKNKVKVLFWKFGVLGGNLSNIFSYFIVYTFDSAHAKFFRLNQLRTKVA